MSCARSHHVIRHYVYRLFRAGDCRLPHSGLMNVWYIASDGLCVTVNIV
jgi:hypothetical protein